MINVQALMASPAEAIASFIGIGVLLLIAGWAADTMLATRRTDD